MSVTLDTASAIAVLDLGDEENRFTPAWLDAVDEALDEVVARGPGALVTVGSGRFYSNGLDLETFHDAGRGGQPYVSRAQALLARVLTIPVPTLAIISGHAFGAGAMLAMAHDRRLMHNGRGYMCLPEVDLGLPFTPGMSALVQAKLMPSAASQAMTTGRRFNADEASRSGLVDGVVEPEAAREEALGYLSGLTEKDPRTLGAIKDVMYREVVSLLDGE